MALTASHMLPLGSIAADFTLYDTVSEQDLSLTQLAGDKATVIIFMCNHCPYVVHILPHLLTTIAHYQPQSIQFIAINANDEVAYPQDGPTKMQQLALEKGFTFPYLFDATQQVARAYQAACTPDFYVFDAQLHCVYRGRYDASRPGNDLPVTGEDLRTALDNLLIGKAVSEQQFASLGCNIKWKA